MFHPSQIVGNTAKDVLFLANIHPDLQQHIINISGKKRLIACDTMNLWINNNLQGLKKVLSSVDLFLLNEEEAKLLAGTTSLNKSLERLHAMGPKQIIIKLGRRGCVIFNKGKISKVPAIADIAVVDPTGAGDCFAGGLLGYMLLYNSSLEDAACYGSAVASFAIEGFGVDHLLNINSHEIKKRVESIRI
jgi:sugar/nucleoside kinase (ribokinase family)